MSIVSTNIKYNFNVLKSNLKSLKSKFDFLNIATIGYSVLGNNIYCVQLGKGPKEVFYSASFHGNEWITSMVLMKFIEDFCIAYTKDSTIYNYSAKSIFETTSIYIVPMVNPDGVNVATSSYFKDSWQYNYAKSISNSYPNIPFPEGWKANIRGIDFQKVNPIFSSVIAE